MVSPNPPWFPGGVERHVGELAKRLTDKVDIDIYCTSLDKDDLDRNEWGGMNVQVFHTRGSAYHYSRKLSQCLNESRDYDIIHAHGFTTYMPLASMKARPKKGFVFTPHYHPVGSTSLYSAARKIYDPVLGSRILKKADRVICVSKTEAGLLKEKYPWVEEKITVIPSGVDIERIRKARPYEKYGRMLLFVGRLEGYKNVDFLIKAVKHLPDDHELYIIGSGPEQDSLVELTNELDLDQAVHFIGNVSDIELNRWRATCDLFITLSEIEAFGSTVIEALASKKPVIVNDKMGLREFSTKYPKAVYGIDLARTKPAELAELIIKVLRKKGKVNEKDFDVSKYDWKLVTKKTLELYKSL